MKAKTVLLTAAVALGTSILASAQSRVVSTSGGTRTVVTGNYCRPYWHGSSVSIGIGFPFYGGFYPGFPYYGGYYPYYPYPYGGYGYGYYPYSGYGYGAPVHGRSVDYQGSTVARVQQRLARAGYYDGSGDGIMGPRTRSAIRAYERRHALPVDGVIDRHLLETMGLA
jgi:Putative peptidoglycan binding domain